MSIMIQAQLTSFEEEIKEQVWKDVMAEEYESIRKMIYGMLYLDQMEIL